MSVVRLAGIFVIVKSLSPEMCAYECKYDCLETERQIKQMIAIREFKNKIYRKERCE